MSVRAIMLRKDRKAKIMKVNTKHTHIKWIGGLYVLSPKAIVNYEIDERIEGAECIWCESNPNPIAYDSTDDDSGNFLGELVIYNALKQTSQGPRINIGSFLGHFSALKNPVNWVWILMGGAILYGLIVGAMGGGVI